MTILEPLTKMAKDLRVAAATLSRDEARFLVDAYYAMQEDRIRDDHQLRQLTANDEPATVLSYLGEQHSLLEQQIAKALDVYSAAQPIGEWMRSIVGIGPVISAGMIAHIDIERATNVGKLWRFAGMDPTRKWHGKKASVLVEAAQEVEGPPWAQLVWLHKATHLTPGRLLQMAEHAHAPISVGAAKQFAAEHGGDTSRLFLVEEDSDNALLTAFKEDPAWAFQRVYGDVAPKWGQLKKALAKCPWNPHLKVLCWKLGESFVKTSGNKNSFYGPIYLREKARLEAKNAAGEFSATAAQTLVEKKFVSATASRAHYTAGRLPPAQIFERAKRYAVKLFLSHLHEKWRKMEGLPVREPYIVVSDREAPHAKIAPPD